MIRFRFAMILLAAWQIFLFNLERPDITGFGNIDLASMTYVVCAIATMAILLLPDLSQIHFLKVFLPIMGLYIGSKLVFGYEQDPDTMFYITATEILVIFVTVIIARQTSLSFLNMEVAVEDTVLEKENSRITSMAEGEEMINNELFRARRYNSKLAIIYLSLTSLEEMKASYADPFDVQSAFKRRYIQGQVAKNVEVMLYRDDLITWFNDNLVICLPGADREAANNLAQDIHTRLKVRLRIDMKIGISTFPDEALIYEDLMDMAIQGRVQFSKDGKSGHDDMPPSGSNGNGQSPITRPEKSASDRKRDTLVITKDSQYYKPFWSKVLDGLRSTVTPIEIISGNMEDVFPADPYADAGGWIEEIPVQSGSSKVIYRRIKRAIDIMLVLMALPVGVFLGVLVALLVYLEDGQPIFFSQKRTGLGGRRFKMYKFRTMVVNAEEMLKELAAQGLAKLDDNGKLAEPLKLERDPRITRVGRILRKTSLDEIPQLFNVLRGDMSLVGPRPTSWDVESYNLFQTERLSVRPGITGLWQIYSRGNTDFNNWLYWDVKYIDRMSFYLDFRIILETFLRVAFRRQKGAR